MTQYVTINVPLGNDGYISTDVTISLIELVCQYKSDVRLESNNSIIVNLKKIPSTMKLRLTNGDTVKLIANGDDAFEVLYALKNYLMLSCNN